MSLTNSIIIGWIIHKPNKVIIIKYRNWDLAIFFLYWNVNILLAKKLKVKAIDVDIILLVITGKPRLTKLNRITKSIEVLRPPTIAKRTLSSCFFIRFFIMIFLYKIKWSLLGFVKNSAYVLAYNAK